MTLSSTIRDQLEAFALENNFDGQGPLAVALVVTERAIKSGLPMDSDSLVTSSQTQVSGLSGKAANRVLQKYNIDPFFGTESGRTSRGSVANMRTLVDLLNQLCVLGAVYKVAVRKHLRIAAI
jgi:hypothetical protein